MKDRVDDAYMLLVQYEKGIVPGGGVAYIRSIDALDKVKAENDDDVPE